jgi:hypothetical protein
VTAPAGLENGSGKIGSHFRILHKTQLHQGPSIVSLRIGLLLQLLNIPPDGQASDFCSMLDPIQLVA